MRAAEIRAKHNYKRSLPAYINYVPWSQIAQYMYTDEKLEWPKKECINNTA